MRSPKPSRAALGNGVFLDSRLALFHEKQRWLAVADLHFGYELSQRAAGRLVPLWGMETIERQLLALLAEYEPRQLLILGDLVHDGASRAEARALIERLGKKCEPIVLAGNHDKTLGGAVSLQPEWRNEGFLFHHGHCVAEATPGVVQVIGHHHPAGTIADGAGLRLKLPAFVQQGSCWILPAFSPWAANTPWKADAETRIWLCTPGRILRLPPAEVAAV